MADTRPTKTHEQIESELLTEVELTRMTFKRKPTEASRAAFTEALRRFNGLILYDKMPGGTYGARSAGSLGRVPT